MATDASPIVADALRGYFAEQGLPENGGLELAWVHVKIGPIPIAFPNIAARREAVRYHDVHHLLTGYRTDWPGEAEIGAFEVAGGCGRCWVGWLLNSGAMGVGAVFWPRRTWRAWLRGRRSGNLFGEPFEPLLRARVDELRSRLRLDELAPPPTVADRLGYVSWALAGLAWMVFLPLALIIAGLVWLL